MQCSSLGGLSSTLACRARGTKPRWVFPSPGPSWGGVVDLLDDGLQAGVRQAVETGPLGQVAADAPVVVLVAVPLV